MTCDKCQSKAPWRIQTGDLWVGPCCVPPSTWAQYPGWREREDLRVARSERARANFGHQAALPEVANA